MAHIALIFSFAFVEKSRRGKIQTVWDVLPRVIAHDPSILASRRLCCGYLRSLAIRPRTRIAIAPHGALTTANTIRINPVPQPLVPVALNRQPQREPAAPYRDCRHDSSRDKQVFCLHGLRSSSATISRASSSNVLSWRVVNCSRSRSDIFSSSDGSGAIRARRDSIHAHNAQ